MCKIISEMGVAFVGYVKSGWGCHIKLLFLAQQWLRKITREYHANLLMEHSSNNT